MISYSNRDDICVVHELDHNKPATNTSARIVYCTHTRIVMCNISPSGRLIILERTRRVRDNAQIFRGGQQFFIIIYVFTSENLLLGPITAHRAIQEREMSYNIIHEAYDIYTIMI